MSPAVRVAAQDSLGNVVPGFTSNVLVTIGTNPAAGTLSGTTTVAAVSGIATFASLRIDNIGSGYALAATSPGVDAAVSSAFDIIASTPTQLAFTVQPSAASAGAVIAPAVEVTVTHEYTFQYIAPLAALISWSTDPSVVLSARSTMRSQVATASP